MYDLTELVEKICKVSDNDEFKESIKNIETYDELREYVHDYITSLFNRFIMGYKDTENDDTDKSSFGIDEMNKAEDVVHNLFDIFFETEEE